jgi:hypothetical protein
MFKKTLLSLVTFLSLSMSAAYTPPVTVNPNLGPNITRTYTTAELTNQYGILQIGKDELWMLNFPDTVTDVLTTREGVVDTKMMGSTVAIAAILNSGQLPVAVKLANGLSQYFLITLSPSKGGGIKNVVVSDANAAPPAPVSAVTTQNSAAAGGARYTLQAPPVQRAPVASVRNQTQVGVPSVMPAATYGAVPQQQTYQQAPVYQQQPTQTYQVPAQPAPAYQQPAAYQQPVAPQAAPLPGGMPSNFPQQAVSTAPGWVSQGAQAPAPAPVTPPLQAQFAVQLDGQTLILYYRLSNPGTTTYTLDDQQIHVTTGGTLLPIYGRGPLTLNGGGSLYGTITMPAGNLTTAMQLAVEWNATAQNTGNITTLRSFVTVQQASMPNWHRLPIANVIPQRPVLAYR